MEEAKMTIREKLEWLAIVSNSILWGGIILFLILVSFTSPILPDEKQHESPVPAEEAAEDGAAEPGPARHRA
jgi:hypothetical protein